MLTQIDHFYITTRKRERFAVLEHDLLLWIVRVADIFDLAAANPAIRWFWSDPPPLSLSLNLNLLSLPGNKTTCIICALNSVHILLLS